MDEGRSAKVAVVDVGPNGSLREAFDRLLRQVPSLLPSQLPLLVVIKPNLCDIAAWETGVTSDPNWLPVLADQLRQRRSDVQIRVIESDAISTYKTFRSCDETFDRLGYREAAEEAGVELVNLSKQDSLDVAVPWFPLPLRIPVLFLQEFFYISLANVKVHPYERMTGTLKNALGLLPDADISQHHIRLPELIYALYMLCTPDLALLDGRVALEGKGPILGDAVRLGKLIASSDPLAADEVCCQIMGVSPRLVPHLRYLARALARRFGEVEILGEAKPRPFVFDPERSHAAILRKFRVKRFCRKVEDIAVRWTDRAGRAVRNPWRFGTDAIGRLLHES